MPSLDYLSKLKFCGQSILDRSITRHEPYIGCHDIRVLESRGLTFIVTSRLEPNIVVVVGSHTEKGIECLASRTSLMALIGRRLRGETSKFESFPRTKRNTVPIFDATSVPYSYSFWASESRRRCVYNETRTPHEYWQSTKKPRFPSEEWPLAWFRCRGRRNWRVSDLDYRDRGRTKPICDLPHVDFERSCAVTRCHSL